MTSIPIADKSRLIGDGRIVTLDIIGLVICGDENPLKRVIIRIGGVVEFVAATAERLEITVRVITFQTNGCSVRSITVCSHTFQGIYMCP